MCKDKSQGGKRCHAHCKAEVDRLSARLRALPEDDDRRAAVQQQLEQAQQDLRETKTGLEQHIHQNIDGGQPYDAEQLTTTVNGYLADSQRGKMLDLPGGTFRVIAAHTSNGHTILEVIGPTSAATYSSGISQCYNKNAFGKQVTSASRSHRPATRSFARTSPACS